MKFGIVGNTTKPIIKEYIPPLMKWLTHRSHEYVLESSLIDYLEIKNKSTRHVAIHELGTKCEMVLAFGGDGTMLSTARAVGRTGVPILGVNLGGLGFLAEVSVDELHPTLEKIFEHHYALMDRMVLRAVHEKHEGHNHVLALNDVVIDKGSYSRLMELQMFINDEYLTTYHADGVIVASPTGSTAYSLSAYGPILTPDVQALIINPICPHSLGARPMVIPADSTITVVPKLHEKEAFLSADGQIEDNVVSEEAIVIQRADFTVRWVQPEGSNFYEVLREKLNWGGR
ncbi:NAD(+)/NADH kinase [candidate division KSB1 bacterium]|nr:NAD(+)/NADH kinase [candidate division KSB1 bacterium]